MMMKTSTKLIVTGATSVLGVVLVAGGAYAATGSMTVADAPGQVLQVSGVGPASTHASDTAAAHANPKAKGLSGGTTARTTTPATTARTTTPATTHAKTPATARPMSHATAMPRRAVSQVAPPAPVSLPTRHAAVQHAPEPVHGSTGTPMSEH